jgi:hypothetical protein
MNEEKNFVSWSSIFSQFCSVEHFVCVPEIVFVMAMEVVVDDGEERTLSTMKSDCFQY